MCKSQQVPLGIILKNEQKVEDMIAIMNLHKYCPTLSTTENTEVAGVDEPVELEKDNFHQILLGL